MQINKAVKEWKGAIGKDYVIERQELQHYLENVTGLERDIPAVVLPNNTEEVQRIVEIANEFETPLYPISKGKNWGLGSRLPVRDDATVVDLSRMDKIHYVDVKHGYVVLEPGVTQIQLYEYLQKNKIPLIMDVTGSGLYSSIIGNALERGVGYFTDRGEEISGLTVVLGNGEILKTGFGHYEGAKTTHLFKHGIGPSLDGLFIQSNCGIVTRSGVNLMHQSDYHTTFVSKIKGEDYLPEFVERLGKLKRKDITKSVVHLGNRERSRISICPLIFENLKERDPQIDEKYLRSLSEELFNSEFSGPWTATGRLFGTRGQVKDAKSQIRKAMKGIGKVMYLTDGFINTAEKLSKVLGFVPYVKKKGIVLSSVRPIYNFTKGVPTDDAVKSVYWPLMNPPKNLDPDHSDCGVIYYLPVTPIDGGEVKKVVSITNEVLKSYGFTPAMTLNTLNKRAMETVISIPFDRGKPDKVKMANESVKELHRKLTAQGIYPYRASIDMMEDVIDPNDSFWQISREIKRSLDPKGIISPGRYNLV